MPRTLLDRALLADALISGAAGLLLLAGGGLAAGLLGLPESLLRTAGLALLPFAALVFWLARQPAPAGGRVRAVIAVNAGWAAGSILLLVSGWVQPTLLGHVLVIGQAVIVAVLAELQLIGLRRVEREAPEGGLGAL